MNKKYSRKRTTKGRRLAALARPFSTRPSVKRVAVTPTGASLPQSVRATQESKAARLRFKAKRSTVGSEEAASQPYVETSTRTAPNESEYKTSSKSKPSGARVGGKKPRKKAEEFRHFVVAHLDKISEQTNIHNVNASSRIIERPTLNPQVDPIEMEYVVDQVGSRKQLSMYESMYPKVKIPLLNEPGQQQVGGSLLTNSSNLLTGQTFAGLNRANVYWPTAYYDWTHSPEARLAGYHSLFNRNQVIAIMENLWHRATSQDPNNPPQITFDEWWEKMTNTIGGDQSYGFPLTSVEVVFEYQNRNTATDLYMSMYMCTPKRILKNNQTPMADWFNPFVGVEDGSVTSNSMLMNPNYRYNPILECEPEVMGTSDNLGPGTNTTDPNTNPISIYANRAQVQTASTEVCLDATPFFSPEFERNWKVITVQKFKLQPQQTLRYKMKLDFTKVLNLKEFFAIGSSGNSEHPMFFPDLTIFPMVKFWGSEVTGESKDLRRQAALGPYLYGRNLAQESTGPRTAPSCLSVQFSGEATVHAKQVPLYMPTGTPSNQALFQRDWLELLLDNFTTKSRQLFEYFDINRGVSSSYASVNDNLVDFYDKDSWSSVQNFPTQTEYATSLVELDSHNGPVPSNAEPSTAILKWANTTMIDYNTIDTVSRTRIVQSQSDINPTRTKYP